jgi:hypothetical protein
MKHSLRMENYDSVTGNYELRCDLCGRHVLVERAVPVVVAQGAMGAQHEWNAEMKLVDVALGIPVKAD